MATKKRILYLGEGVGMYVKGFKDKESAVKAMRDDALREKSLDESSWSETYAFDPNEITTETVVETVYRQHRHCETETVGDDDICYNCGERCGTGGRETFAFFCKNFGDLL